MPRDHVKADLWFKRFAKKLESRTDPDTLTSLGYLYEKGEGVPKDLDRANDLYERAAISRNPSALFNLGLLCLRDDWPKRNPMKAVQAFARAAAIGSPGAQYMLASCFYKGIGVPKDRKKSFEWLNKAAEGGDMTAESVLGLFYDSGKYGVEIDLGLAKKWYQKAAAQGDYTSQQRLGHLMDPR
jgi:TPR repeat protein